MTRILLAFAILFLGSCGGTEENFDTQTYEKTKETLEEREKKNPEQFLIASSTDKKNLIGQKVIVISIKNNASVATYKDVQVKIDFYSQTGTLLEENKETVYKVIPPNNTITYKTKFFAPKGSDDVRVTIVNAKVEGE